MSTKLAKGLRAVGAALALTVTANLGWSTIATAGDPNGNFMVRLQGTYLNTDDHTKSIITAAGANINPPFHAKTDDLVLPTATLTYFLNKNIGLELFCCFAKTDIVLKNAGATVGEVASTWMFPPIVTLTYHFDGMGAFKPYVGAGVQWIHFFSEKTGKNALGATGVDIDDAFGFVLQAGVDVSLGGGWYLNADVKKSWLDTEVTFKNAAFGGIGTTKAKHDLDPLTVSMGIGYRFNLEDIFGRRGAAPLK